MGCDIEVFGGSRRVMVVLDFGECCALVVSIC